MNTPNTSNLEEKPLAIVANSVSIFYGERSVFHNLDVSIPLGAKCHISGVNGSGKSSLLRCLAGVQLPSEGEVSVANLRLSRRSEFSTYKSRFAPVFLEEQDAFYPMLSVRENIAFAQSYVASGGAVAEVRQDASKLLQRLQLDKYLEHTPSKLSRGERRRLSLLLALIGEPQILFLDEPFVSLDERSQNIFSDLLKELRPEQTLLLVSHNATLADAICDSSVALNKGRGE